MEYSYTIIKLNSEYYAIPYYDIVDTMLYSKLYDFLESTKETNRNTMIKDKVHRLNIISLNSGYFDLDELMKKYIIIIKSANCYYSIIADDIENTQIQVAEEYSDTDNISSINVDNKLVKVINSYIINRMICSEVEDIHIINSLDISEENLLNFANHIRNEKYYKDSLNEAQNEIRKLTKEFLEKATQVLELFEKVNQDYYEETDIKTILDEFMKVIMH
ncbi:hypothetical protein [Clostridium manihotivorum]|uniref:Uncharacterized protein n=1 Tax=Clostridium manihotivorum TaxID=2320868 RepID=A0A410DUZ6_9CLOT|nr:hypothetical protein [Clostridium manihotivorum]QAA32792.1 hypothetical protein C1I91_14720 [Clostridium manihotivorum]